MLNIYSALGSTTGIVLITIAVIVDIGLALWTYKDAEERNLDSTTWTCVVCICCFLGFIAYIMSRDDAPQRRPPPGYSGATTGPSPSGYPARGYQQRGYQQGGYYQGGYNTPQANRLNQNLDAYGRPPSPYQQPPPGYNNTPQTRMPDPFGDSAQTTRPDGLGVPPSEYGETEFYSNAKSEGAHDQKVCKFCNSRVPKKANHCPICGGDEFEI